MKRWLCLMLCLCLCLGAVACRSQKEDSELSEESMESGQDQPVEQIGSLTDLTRFLPEDQNVMDFELRGSELLCLLSTYSMEEDRFFASLLFIDTEAETTREVLLPYFSDGAPTEVCFLQNGDLFVGGMDDRFWFGVFDAENPEEPKTVLERDYSGDSPIFCVDRIGNGLWYVEEGGVLVWLDLITGQEEKRPEMRADLLLQAAEGKIYFSLNKKVYKGFRTAEEVREVELYAPYYSYSETGFFYTNAAVRPGSASYEESHFLGSYEQDSVMYEIQKEGNLVGLGMDTRAFLSEENPEGTWLYLVDYRRGVILDSILLTERREDPAWMSCIHDNGDAAAMLVYIGEERERLMLWHYGAQTKEPLPSQEVTANSMRWQMNAVADKLRQETGVGVHVQSGEEVPGDGMDYYFDTDFTLPTVYFTLQDVDTILRAFPGGMLREMCVDPVQQIDIYFSEKFLPADSYSIDNAAAVAYTWDNSRMIVLSSDNASDLPHELMHVMEDRLWTFAYPETGSREQENGAYLDYWDALNPADFDYYWTYHYEDRDTLQYTYYGDSDNVYFIDAYSKSFPSEDRARIFENLFWNETREEGYFEEPNLKAKGQYLCALIHGAFRSMTADTEVPWEKAVSVRSLQSYDPEVKAYHEWLYSYY